MHLAHRVYPRRLRCGSYLKGKYGDFVRNRPQGNGSKITQDYLFLARDIGHRLSCKKLARSCKGGNARRNIDRRAEYVVRSTNYAAVAYSTTG